MVEIQTEPQTFENQNELCFFNLFYICCVIPFITISFSSQYYVSTEAEAIFDSHIVARFSDTLI